MGGWEDRGRWEEGGEEGGGKGGISRTYGLEQITVGGLFPMLEYVSKNLRFSGIESQQNSSYFVPYLTSVAEGIPSPIVRAVVGNLIEYSILL